VGITSQNLDLWGFCGRADGVLATCLPAWGHDQRQDFVCSTVVVTECADLASLAGSETSLAIRRA
jgi:hypothetical protein